jgi:excisionase family DNA binding protein
MMACPAARRPGLTGQVRTAGYYRTHPAGPVPQLTECPYVATAAERRRKSRGYGFRGETPTGQLSALDAGTGCGRADRGTSPRWHATGRITLKSEGMITAKEAASRLHISPKECRQWIRAGVLPGVKVGQRWMVKEPCVEVVM